MAATTNAVQSLITNSRFSSLYLSTSKALPSCHLLKNRLSPPTRSSCLALTSSWDKKEAWVPLGISSAKLLKFTGRNQNMRRRGQVDFPVASAADADDSEIEISERYAKPSKSFAEIFPALVTGFFFFLWYFLNVIFNILNKKVYNYFPYPYFVSVIHLVVGVAYCLVSWGVGLPKRAPIDKELLALLTPVAFCHALGHVMSNVSFAAVAVSFTHTIKALEPFFNAAASQFVLGHQIPLSLWLSLAPVVIGVPMASLTELSFNWTGFISAMISNIAFTYRSIYLKKAMAWTAQMFMHIFLSLPSCSVYRLQF